MSYYERALVASILIGALSGLVGTVVVMRKRAFYTQALTHATFPGAIVAALFGASVVMGAAVSVLILVALMSVLSRVKRQGTQVASGVVLTAGFALGAFAQSFFPALPIKVESYLVGSILTVTVADLVGIGVALAVATVALVLFGKEIEFSTFDPDGFRAAGYKEWPIEVLSLGLITLTVVTVMPSVGAILSLALIAAPAAAARLVTRSIRGAFALAPVLGALSGVIGVVLSRTLDTAAGATIALVAVLFFALALGIRKLRDRMTPTTHTGSEGTVLANTDSGFGADYDAAKRPKEKA